MAGGMGNVRLRAKRIAAVIVIKSLARICGRTATWGIRRNADFVTRCRHHRGAAPEATSREPSGKALPDTRMRDVFTEPCTGSAIEWIAPRRIRQNSARWHSFLQGTSRTDHPHPRRRRAGSCYLLCIEMPAKRLGNVRRMGRGVTLIENRRGRQATIRVQPNCNGAAFPAAATPYAASSLNISKETAPRSVSEIRKPISSSRPAKVRPFAARRRGQMVAMNLWQHQPKLAGRAHRRAKWHGTEEGTTFLQHNTDALKSAFKRVTRADQ